MPIKKVSIIIPVYNRLEWIGRSLEALAKQTYEGKFEIIVIDDGSPKAKMIQEIVDSFRNRLDVIYSYLHKQGPSAAKNAGIKLSTGEIVCFLDDDSICDQKWLSNIVETFLYSSSVDLVNGRTLSYERQKYSMGMLLENSVYQPKKRWATCNIAYRRGIFDCIGMFDETYKLASWEDNDLGFRAWLKKKKHIYQPSAIVYHIHEQTMQEFKEKSFRNGYGLGHFIKKHISSYPLMAIGIFLYVIKGLFLIIHPGVILCRRKTKAFLRFAWARDSMRGCMRVFLR